MSRDNQIRLYLSWDQFYQLDIKSRDIIMYACLIVFDDMTVMSKIIIK